MTGFDAIMIAEGAQEAESQKQYLEAWSLLIKSGQCWSLQGFFGRNAMHLINAGVISKEGEILQEFDDDGSELENND